MTKAHQRVPKDEVLTMRLNAHTDIKLDWWCKQTGKTKSDFARMAIQKALAIDIPIGLRIQNEQDKQIKFEEVVLPYLTKVQLQEPTISKYRREFDRLWEETKKYSGSWKILEDNIVLGLNQVIS
jgi:hypothetical protein